MNLEWTKMYKHLGKALKVAFAGKYFNFLNPFLDITDKANAINDNQKLFKSLCQSESICAPDDPALDHL